MEWLSERFARRSLLRCLALSAMGAAALLAPGFLEKGLACCAMIYLLANGVALAVRACAGGPHDPASRAGLMMACLLLGLAGASAALMGQMQQRVMLYFALLLLEGAVYLAMGLLAFRSAPLAALAAGVMAGSLVWMLAAPFGGLTNLHRYVAVLLLLSALYELAARRLWRGRAWEAAR